MKADRLEGLLDNYYHFVWERFQGRCPPEKIDEARQAIRDHCEAGVDRLEDALHQIKVWSEAYPLAVFPEPDFKKAAEVLKANGLTLDAISASNMRHVITQVQNIVNSRLPQPESK